MAWTLVLANLFLQMFMSGAHGASTPDYTDKFIPYFSDYSVSSGMKNAEFQILTSFTVNVHNNLPVRYQYTLGTNKPQDPFAKQCATNLQAFQGEE